MLAARLALVWSLLLACLSGGALPAHAGTEPSPARAAPPADAAAKARPELVVEFLDVGQGAAVLVTSPTGKRVLVDGGPPESGRRVAEALRRRGVQALDLLVVSHPHLDHVGGLADAQRVAPPKLVLDPQIAHPLPSYRALLDAWERSGVRVARASGGRRIDLGGGAVAELLGPPTERLRGTRADVNANSVILLLRLGKRSILLTGDAEPETEAYLLRTKPDALRADVLMVPHHGSRHSSTGAFLRAVGAGHAVISVGAGNDYGHPHARTLDRLAEAGARIWRTDRQGTVRVHTDGERLEVEALGKEPEPEANFLGSRRSDVYHRPGCDGAGRIAPHNRITWPSAAAAEAEGRRAARDCIAAPRKEER